MKNVYYLIGFVGNQAHNYIKCMAKNIGRQVCMENFVGTQFAEHNKDDEANMEEPIKYHSIPAEMVAKVERYDGPALSGRQMLEVFSSIDHVYSTVATVDNFIA